MATVRQSPKQSFQVVIVGGGFAGLYAAQSLKHLPVNITLVDKRNFHLFQPLLYQVASGALSPGDIASPLRDILAHQRNVEVVMGEAIDLDIEKHLLILRDGSLRYDALILAPGSDKQYFGHEEWQTEAPGLKTLEDAVKIRRKLLLALESAEKEPDPEKKRAWMTFTVVGGGPTGVELCGALAELVHSTFKTEFRHIDTRQVRILMLEAGDRILSTYPEDLQASALKRLTRLGVTVSTGKTVKAIAPNKITVGEGDQAQDISTRTILWTAGVKASPLGQLLGEKTGCPMDKGGRVNVAADCSVPDHPEIFVLGDLANFSQTQDKKPLPGLASVAMQQGQYMGKVIQSRLENKPAPPFRYLDKGNLAIIGRNAAIAEIGSLHLSGFPAWLIWLTVHIFYLVGFDNKVLVTFQWAWNYLTRGRTACLIMEQT